MENGENFESDSFHSIFITLLAKQSHCAPNRSTLAVDYFCTLSQCQMLQKSRFLATMYLHRFIRRISETGKDILTTATPRELRQICPRHLPSVRELMAKKMLDLEIKVRSQNTTLAVEPFDG